MFVWKYHAIQNFDFVVDEFSELKHTIQSIKLAGIGIRRFYSILELF